MRRPTPSGFGPMNNAPPLPQWILTAYVLCTHLNSRQSVGLGQKSRVATASSVFGGVWGHMNNSVSNQSGNWQTLLLDLSLVLSE